MTTTLIDDEGLAKFADELEANRELHEATLDGLGMRIKANIAALEESDLDERMKITDEETAHMAVDVLKADVADMQDLDADMADADAEEDQLLEDDELPVEETAARLTPEDTGLAE